MPSNILRTSRRLSFCVAVLSLLGLSQTVASGPPKFDAESVIAMAPGDRPDAPRPSGVGWAPGLEPGRVYFHNTVLAQIIATAYGINRDLLDRSSFYTGPDWVKTDRFTVEGKASDGSSQEALRLMLQTLLADRFKLVVHWQPRAMPAYALNRVGAGPKSASLSTDARLVKTGPEIVAALALFVRSPVVDQAGLIGSYQWKMDPTKTPFCTRDIIPLGQAPPAQPLACDGVPSIFDVLKQNMGLQLEARASLPVNVLVIDDVEHPSGNL